MRERHSRDLKRLLDLELERNERVQSVVVAYQELEEGEKALFRMAAGITQDRAGGAREPSHQSSNDGNDETQPDQVQPIVRNLMKSLLEDHPSLLTETDIANLMDRDYTQKILGLQLAGFPLLRACLRSLQYVKLRLLPEGVIMSHSYSSDISREQFARILPCLESARRRTKPRTVDLYDVFCGVLYLLKSGCQWRMLPADFPDWRTCYKYFRQWSERPDPAKYSILEQVLKKIGWRGPAKQWSERTDQLLYRGLPERQEHRQRREQGL